MRLRSFSICMLLGAGLLSSGTARADTVAAGAAHTVVAKPDGTVWTWGGNASGQLGDGTTTAHRVPAQVPGVAGIVAVAAGANHSLALKADGTLLAWGSNSSGQLGDGTTVQRSAPVLLSLSHITAIAAGERHSVALEDNGTVWTWGHNSNGQLGHGSTTNSSTPLAVASLSTVTAIGAGFSHTLVVKADGTVWGWGTNGNRELGDGSTTQRPSPVQMTGVTGATRVAGGSTHSVVLKSDGTVVTSGSNAYGKLGDGTSSTRTSPYAIPSFGDVVAVHAGEHHTVVRKIDGSVWAWGRNDGGQVGDASTTDRKSPTAVATLSGIDRVASGSNHNVAVTTAGVVWTWGSNHQGQLGDGTTVPQAAPIPISGPAYEWKTATPVFSPVGGVYTTPRTVTLTDVTPNAQIHYTLTGDEPTTGDPFVASGGTVSIERVATLVAKAWATGMPESNSARAVYSMTVGQPTASPSATRFTSPQTVSLSTSTPGATIRYTTDGSAPTDLSPIYSAPLSIGTTTTLQAIGLKADWNTSTTYSGLFRMDFGTLSAPTVSPAAGTYTSSVTITLAAAAGADIRYTTNGTTPTSSSLLYAGPFAVDASSVLTARAFHPDYATSPSLSAAYTLVVATPVLAPAGGAFTAGQTISVSTTTPGATLTYTLNGAEPTASDAVVPADGTLVAGNFSLKVRAWKTGLTPSSTTTGVYTVTGGVAARVDGRSGAAVALRSDGVVWQWGNGVLLPSLVPGLTGATAVAPGASHTLALRANGSVVGWGSNWSGRIGDGTTVARDRPVPVSGLTDVIAIAAGEDHSLAVTSSGDVYGWGANAYGQVGDGTTVDRLVPVQIPGLSNVVRVAAGDRFSVALRADGTVWTWGTHWNGRLGDGSAAARWSPAQVSGLTGVSAISAGFASVLCVRTDGTVISFGQGHTALPAVVAGLSDVTAVAAGSLHNLALTVDGRVWTWGANPWGQLGDGTTIDRTTPAPLATLSRISTIGAESNASFAVDEDGVAWSWGGNSWGQLGRGTRYDDQRVPAPISGPGMAWKVATPTIVLAGGKYFAEQNVIVNCGDPYLPTTLHYTTSGNVPTALDPSIDCGTAVSVPHSLTLKISGWRAGAPTSEVASAAYELQAVKPVLSVPAGRYAAAQTVALSTSTSGASITYTLDGSEPSAASTAYVGPIAVAHPLTLKARALRSGWTMSDVGYATYWIDAAVAVAAPVVSLNAHVGPAEPLISLTCATPGSTIRYTLDGRDPDASSPVYRFPIRLQTSATLKARAFLAHHQPSVVVSASYSLDEPGATATPAVSLGGGSFVTAQTVTVTGPVGATLRYTLNGLDPQTSDTVIASGASLTVERACVLKVRAWATGLTPSAVRRADFVIVGALAAGDDFSLALKSNGTLWSWGENVVGQLGDGATPNRTTPLQIATQVRAIAAGARHGLALMNNATVMAWGQNTSGQIGDGTTTPRRTPVAVTGLTDVIAIAAGSDHSLALRADGSVWAWGENTRGQLGDGSTTRRLAPVQVVGLADVTAIAAGTSFSLALSSGSADRSAVYGWGRNDAGQVGDGSGVDRLWPTLVPGLPAISEISAGAAWTLARAETGDVWAWGNNASGQLALGNTTRALVPVRSSHLQGARRVVASRFEHGFAVDRRGSPWLWGNDDGQLGDGTRGNVNAPAALIPQRPLGIGNVWVAALGARHTLVADVRGVVFAAGRNDFGQLGDGAATRAVTFVPALVGALVENTWLGEDSDHDGLPNWREYQLGLDPLNPDTNGDGLLDGLEADGVSSPQTDADGDGVPNWIEQQRGTDPFRADSDGDGVPDSTDAFPLDPSRSTLPPPDPGDTTAPVITLLEPTNARPVP